jgi:hypothetical protein
VPIETGLGDDDSVRTLHEDVTLGAHTRVGEAGQGEQTDERHRDGGDQNGAGPADDGGADAVTYRAIAHRVGISLGTLSYHLRPFGDLRDHLWQEVEVRLTDPQGSLVGGEVLKTDLYGVVRWDLGLPSSAREGVYTLTLQEGEDVAEARVRVERFVAPVIAACAFASAAAKLAILSLFICRPSFCYVCCIARRRSSRISPSK